MHRLLGLLARKGRKGQAIVEYGILIGAASLATLVATTMLGHKSGYLYATTAGALPSIHALDEGRVFIGKLVDTQNDNGVAIMGTTPGSFEQNFGFVGTDFAEDDSSVLTINQSTP